MNKEVNSRNFLNVYPGFKENSIKGRYITQPKIEEVLNKAKSQFEVAQVGSSFLNVPIHSIRIGSGSKKILAWSQMHGNEGTTTKAICDLLNLFAEHKDDREVRRILEECTFLVIPILNPDGAARYTRENVNKVDLNRDANNLSEQESNVLRETYENFFPDFCFNLHDQRTIFSAGNTSKVATVSFLSPAMNEERTVTAVRTKAMQVISYMNKQLQEYIPGQVGRYDDAFNINCTGDTFQSLETPTILFEAGHFPEDYQREETRKYIAFSIFAGLNSIATGKYEEYSSENYMEIPENHKNFYDIILRNALIKDQNLDVALQFEEKLKGGDVHFLPRVQTMAPSLTYFGHREFDCRGQRLKTGEGKWPIENDIVHTFLLNDEKLSIISQDNQ
ncbi:M14 family zinc carboxypeptidase [Salinimicrobium soli]|uniref:M14 family zinc carboxypeptidase n=1 Tax=Salinimicrobium soli TaxID=1254399 RepID=UPI003AAD3004